MQYSTSLILSRNIFIHKSVPNLLAGINVENGTVHRDILSFSNIC